MFWHTPLTPRLVGSTRYVLSSIGNACPHVIVETRRGLGAIEEYLVDAGLVYQEDFPGALAYVYQGPGAYAYYWYDQLGHQQVRLNPNYVNTNGPGVVTSAPSTPPGPPPGLQPTPPPGGSPSAAVPGRSVPVMSNFALQYSGNWLSGGYCVHCSAPRHFGCGCNPDGWDEETGECEHTDLVDTGMPIRYCKHCPAKLRLVNLEWTVV